MRISNDQQLQQKNLKYSLTTQRLFTLSKSIEIGLTALILSY